ncbi:RFX DNA-binding domain protein [Trichinella nativa]|uniref:RFX DNA-binding domain protein n=1 Tax=Trichinella nativa TaxID=6335 RepID=A0A1Y3EY70_9BILA|nr:RFX DNA-binding domain protein [Trichinella nativa]
MESGSQVEMSSLHTISDEASANTSRHLSSHGRMSTLSGTHSQPASSVQTQQTSVPRVVIVASGQFNDNNLERSSVSHHRPIGSAEIGAHTISNSTRRNHVTTGMTTRAASNQARQIVIMQQPASSASAVQRDSVNSQTITLTVSDDDGRQEARAVYPVQYIGNSQHSAGEMLYSSSESPNAHELQANSQYAIFSNDGGYSSQLGSYFPQQQQQQGSYQQSELSSPPSTFVIQSDSVQQRHGTATSGSVVAEDTSAQQLSHTTRASPATIHWLLQNYETAEGVSLPRCTLYSHYVKHCTEHKLDPVNAASFGKLIRSVFLGLRTRRLGTRGNSKYHYYGIRMKPDSPLNRFNEENMMTSSRQQQHPTPSNKRIARAQSVNSVIYSTTGEVSARQHVINQERSNQSIPNPPTGSGPFETVENVPSKLDIQRQYLGAGMVPNVMPPILKVADLDQLDLQVEHAETFFARYRLHCRVQMTKVDLLWRCFWMTAGPLNTITDVSDSSPASGLTRGQLYNLCSMKPILEYIREMDCQFYQVVVNVLITNILKPIPTMLTQSIRNFAKQLEPTLSAVLEDVPEELFNVKLDAGRSFGQILRRYTGLNHMAQAARGVLQNSSQMNQMFADFSRVEFPNVLEQAGWVCFCDANFVQQIATEFKTILQSNKTLEQWVEWLHAVVDRCLPSHTRQDIFQLEKESRKFLLNWSFYTSTIMRELTLRSAPSFGSFHLIRLLFDELLFYIIEQRIASAVGQPAVAISTRNYRQRFLLPDTTVSNGNLMHGIVPCAVVEQQQTSIDPTTPLLNNPDPNAVLNGTHCINEPPSQSASLINLSATGYSSENQVQLPTEDDGAAAASLLYLCADGDVKPMAKKTKTDTVSI